MKLIFLLLFLTSSLLDVSTEKQYTATESTTTVKNANFKSTTASRLLESNGSYSNNPKVPREADLASPQIDNLEESEEEKAGENSVESAQSESDQVELVSSTPFDSTSEPNNQIIRKSSIDKQSGRIRLNNGEQEEKLLLRALMHGYEKDVRPVRNASHPVLIQVGITLTQIFDMDEKNQVLTTNVWLDQEWHDELLQWNPADFGGLKSIRLPCKLMWLPDIVLYNNADDYTRGYMPSRAMLSSEGKVFWPPPTKFRSTCPVDVTYFPFDDQVCTLKLGSWTYHGYQVDITNRTSEVDLSNYVQNGEWELLEAHLQRNIVYYSCCDEPYPDVTITLIIRRKTLYYIYNIVFPCMMLSILTLLVFCLPPDSGEKVALGITVLLAFSVFMLAIAEKMPETSESIPLIGIYLTAVMAITSISVIATVIVLNLHYLGPRVQPIPSWLRCFLPKDDIDFLREKSLLLPYSSKTGNRRNQPHYLISQKVRQAGTVSYSTATPPLPQTSVNINAATKVISTTKPDATTTTYNTSSNHKSQQIRNRNQDNLFTTLTMNPEQLPQPNTDFELGTLSLDVEKAGDDDEFSSADSIDDDNFSKAPSDRIIRQETHSLFPKHNRQQQRHHQQTRPTHNHLKGQHTSSPSKRLNRFNNNSSPRHRYNPSNGVSPKDALSASSSVPAQPLLKVQQELLKSIQHLLSKQEELEFQNLLVAEWRLVAQVVDRILFWIFFLITVASSGVFLVILPLYKRSWNGPN